MTKDTRQAILVATFAMLAGFRFLDRHLAAREADSTRFGSFEGHAAWLREFVAGIDQETAATEPNAAADDLA